MPKLRVDSVSTLPILQSWLSAVLIAGIVCVAVTAVVYRRDLATERAALEQETTHVIELQEELLLFELRAIHSDLLYLASQHPLQRFVAGDVSAREALERA